MGGIIFPTMDNGLKSQNMIPDSPSVPAVSIHRAGVTVNMPQPTQSLSQAHPIVSISSLSFYFTAGSARN